MKNQKTTISKTIFLILLGVIITLSSCATKRNHYSKTGISLKLYKSYKTCAAYGG